MTLSKDQFKRYHAQMMASPGVEGGFTVHAVTGEEPSAGSMVSYPGETMTTPAAATKPSALPHFVNQNREALSRTDHFLGGWKPDTGAFTTLDKSQNVSPKPHVEAEYGADVAEADSLTSALDLGLARDQYSVYNFKRGRSIETGGDRA